MKKQNRNTTLHLWTGLITLSIALFTFLNLSYAGRQEEGVGTKLRMAFISEELLSALTLAPSSCRIPDEKPYNWEKSTEDNFRADGVGVSEHDVVGRTTTTTKTPTFCGKFASVRSKLDYSYHANYSLARQALQDDLVVESLLNRTWLVDSDSGELCGAPTQPWIVFTAGVFGAGKSWTLRQLAHKQYFPAQAFVVVDPDEIRRLLPEYKGYVQRNPMTAGELTRKEAGYLTEVVTAAALARGQNVLVDGSLRDYGWYQQYFAELREQYHDLRIGILHVTAPREAILTRVQSRSKETGRVVPPELLEEAMVAVPKSVSILAPLTDFYAEIWNGGGGAGSDSNDDDDLVELKTPGMSWDDFRSNWVQKCSKNGKEATASRTVEPPTCYDVTNNVVPNSRS